MSGKTILLTRPQAASQRLAEELSQKGLTSFIEPMLRIKTLDVKIPDLSLYQGLVFTSANAVRAFHDLGARGTLPAYVVGKHTQDVALSCGFQDVRCAGLNVMALVRFLKKERPGRLLYLCGVHLSRSLKSLLPEMEIEETSVYLSEKEEKFTQSLWRMLEEKEISTALFFSARTAQAFADILENSGRVELARYIKVLCLSDEVLESLSVLPWSEAYVCNTPERSAMLALIDRIYGEEKE